MSEHSQSRVQDGGVPVLRLVAPRIEQAVGSGDAPIYTWGSRRSEPNGRYWVYNTEPLHLPSKRTAQYMALLDGAERVFDYSQANVSVYPRGEFRPIRLGAVAPPPPADSCSVDVLFYGHLTERRKAVVEALGATVLAGIFGEQFGAAVRSARIVLCVNAYDARNGNPFRAFPALEAGARLVVEETDEEGFNRAVAPYATVVPYDRVVPACREILSRLRRAA